MSERERESMKSVDRKREKKTNLKAIYDWEESVVLCFLLCLPKYERLTNGLSSSINQHTHNQIACRV